MNALNCQVNCPHYLFPDGQIEIEAVSSLASMFKVQRFASDLETKRCVFTAVVLCRLCNVASSGNTNQTQNTRTKQPNSSRYWHNRDATAYKGWIHVNESIRVSP